MAHTVTNPGAPGLDPEVWDSTAANGAPEAEPEVWDHRIPDFNPLFGRAPEPDMQSPAGAFDFESYMAEERTKDILRFSTAGSVDDGKSTLIGRLLYDTQSVYDDQVRAIEGKGTTAPGVLDLALLTDGLRAEREQGITIDVAYRYFSTAYRKFIIADTPGHEQYTRNMATGASTADLAIVLVDARKGVLVQSRRHAAITTLLGVRQVVVAINKMDLVGFDEGIFAQIQREFTAFFERLHTALGSRPELHFLPVSALAGDNVTLRSAQTPWYAGPSLLELLEAVPTTETDSHAPFRLPVQRVVRPNLDFRGFAGQIAAGSIKPGDEIMALPSRRTSRVKEIVTFSGNLPHAHAPQSVTLTLEDELDISRGDLLVPAASPATATTHFVASLVWMDGEPLALNRRYLLKHTSRTVNASVAVLRHRLDITTLEEQPADTLELNSIGVVEITSSQPLFVDAYTANRHTGSFVLIDPVTNATAAAGMIRDLAGRHNLAESPRREAFADAESTSETTRRRMLVQLEEIAAFFAASEPTSQLAAALGVARKLILPDAHDDSGPTDSSAVQEEESR
jgi:sulfate adenylyltransferase subunit 1